MKVLEDGRRFFCSLAIASGVCLLGTLAYRLWSGQPSGWIWPGAVAAILMLAIALLSIARLAVGRLLQNLS